MSRDLFKQIIDSTIVQNGKEPDQRDYTDRDQVLKQIFLQKATQILSRPPETAPTDDASQ